LKQQSSMRDFGLTISEIIESSSMFATIKFMIMFRINLMCYSVLGNVGNVFKSTSYVSENNANLALNILLNICNPPILFKH
jgi:hypothetical protein